MKNLLALLKNNAKLTLVGGITLALLGLLCLKLPLETSLTFVGAVSIAMLAYGISICVFAFNEADYLDRILSFIGGTLVSIWSVLMLLNPMENLYALTIITLCYFIIDGVMSLITAYQIRKTKVWAWSLFSGFISITLAVVLFSQWPNASIYVLGTLIGVRFIISGAHMIIIASASSTVLTDIEEIQHEIVEINPEKKIMSNVVYLTPAVLKSYTR